MDNSRQNIVVTIGRQFGSGGRELGQKLARRLGIKYYDKELLSEAARRAGVSQEFFEKKDERFPSFVNGIFAFAFGYHNMGGSYGSGQNSISDENLYRAQSDFIRSLTDEGSCVIVGRTADYVLRDFPGLVSIFVHAPEDICARRIAERSSEPITLEKAKQKAARINKLRANYYNFYTDRQWGHSSTYHLSVDTSKMSMDDIVEMICDYISRRFPQFASAEK
ncbi:MAG: cytidylate kinase-like family protein [Paramuribaculum sp.]|nr:cytidylate kinase-like family protein [Paramuribaculum sp.]